MSEPLLSEFEAWCKGEGRGGNKAGWHTSALDAAARYRTFLAYQELKLLAYEKRTKTADNG